MDLKTIGVAVGLSVTLATSVGTYFVLQYRVGALEVGLAQVQTDVKQGSADITQLVCDVHDLTVCPGGGR
jgi:hypothetical protein|tara:strand:- start:4251 stop:4460 length:210 start_codon:yes stop_codon:yes gene_type:complete